MTILLIILLEPFLDPSLAMCVTFDYLKCESRAEWAKLKEKKDKSRHARASNLVSVHD